MSLEEQSKVPVVPTKSLFFDPGIAALHTLWSAQQGEEGAHAGLRKVTVRGYKPSNNTPAISEAISPDRLGQKKL